MIRKIPIIDSTVRFGDIVYAAKMARQNSVCNEFCRALSRFIEPEYVYCVDSGISSFFLVLNALKKISNKKEVLLPAYTAGSLVTAVVKAGLRPILCDITLKDFNLDINSLQRAVSGDTLAIVCVHLFGIGMEDIGHVKKKIASDIFLVEDCAQAMGSKIGGKQVGGFGDISFFSFNRGKNLSLYGGGCIATGSHELSRLLHRQIQQEKEPDLFSKYLIPFKNLAISLAVNRFVYGLCFPFISLFKDNSPLVDIEVKKFIDFQASLGLVLLERIEGLFRKRYQNGIFLIDGLKGMDELIVPSFSRGTPVFNRFPLVFKDLDKREKVKQKLWQEGIESSDMYIHPLHHMFDLGYAQDDFPHATYFAEHLLALPVHPSLRQQDLEKMVDILRYTGNK